MTAHPTYRSTHIHIYTYTYTHTHRSTVRGCHKRVLMLLLLLRSRHQRGLKTFGLMTLYRWRERVAVWSLLVAIARCDFLSRASTRGTELGIKGIGATRWPWSACWALIHPLVPNSELPRNCTETRYQISPRKWWGFPSDLLASVRRNAAPCHKSQLNDVECSEHAR